LGRYHLAHRGEHGDCREFIFGSAFLRALTGPTPVRMTLPCCRASDKRIVSRLFDPVGGRCAPLRDNDGFDHHGALGAEQGHPAAGKGVMVIHDIEELTAVHEGQQARAGDLEP